MNGVNQSDAGIVLMTAANKEAQALAESNEGRAATKGNLQSRSTCCTRGRQSVSQAVVTVYAGKALEIWLLLSGN
ncbi:MAG: hypothetical protein OXI60_08260 [Acidiferrobacterales bacterium]|nr:hypothetical protein [Acidiferrobacterales bacterium]